MAVKATVFKADLQISDMDRHYYQHHTLTLAQHPSETEERMMVRLLAFALFADEALEFTRGISSDDEPDLWQKDLTGQIKLWIDLGTPDEKRIRKAAGRAEKVVVICFGSNAGQIWWAKNSAALSVINNLSVINIPKAQSDALAALVERTMQLQCNIQDGTVWLGNDDAQIQIDPEHWFDATV